jgi:penicillin-binding protein 1C
MWKRLTASPTGVFRRLARRSTAVMLCCALAAGLLLAAFEVAVRLVPAPLQSAMPPTATLLLDRAGRPVAAFAASDGRWHLPLADADISPHLLSALVAVEDARFYDHGGVDWVGVAAAARDNATSARRRGASTLTMQLYRLREQQSGRAIDRGWLGKVRQALHARQIDRSAGKRELLIEYVNRAPFGGALVGAGAASWRYFGKPCKDLSLGEAALLAGLPQNPNAYRPDRHPEGALRRRSHVLRRMEAVGVISAAQRAEADAEPLTASWRPLPQERAVASGVSADGAAAALLAISARTRGGIYTTTLDSRLQATTCRIAAEQLASLGPSGVSAATVVVLDTTSADVLASVSLERTVGGRLSASAMDLATRPRSTGSVLKPFIYAAAFDAGIAGPRTLLSDEPTAWAGYMPANFDRTFAGNLPAAEALARSRNIPAMTLLERVGIARTVGVMESLGIATPARSSRPPGLSLAIGGVEATPMEIAQAYAALARDGIARPARLRWPPDVQSAAPVGARPVAALRASACRQTLAALVDEARTRAISPEAAAARVAWKTGTSSGHRDAWCAAVTPSVTVVAWFGSTDGRGASVLVGVDAAAPTALRVAALADPSPAQWPTADLGDGAVAAGRLPNRDPATSVGGARTSPRLAIQSPAHQQTILLDPDLPLRQQRVALRAALRSSRLASAQPTNSGLLHWFADGTALGTAAAGETVWWTPTPGEHRIRVADGDGRSDTVVVRVQQLHVAATTSAPVAPR